MGHAPREALRNTLPEFRWTARYTCPLLPFLLLRSSTQITHHPASGFAGQNAWSSTTASTSWLPPSIIVISLKPSPGAFAASIDKMENVHGRPSGSERPSTPPTACQPSSVLEVDSVYLQTHPSLMPAADDRKYHKSDEDDDWCEYIAHGFARAIG